MYVCECAYTLHVAISQTGQTQQKQTDSVAESLTGFCSQTEVLELWTACGYVLKWPLIVCCLQLQRNVAYYSMLYVWQVEFASLFMCLLMYVYVCVCVVVACLQTKEQFNEIAKKIVATDVNTHTHVHTNGTAANAN